MATENVTTKFKVDISDLKKGISDANKQIKLLTAEMKNANAGMKKGEETTDSLTAKIEKQTKVVEQEEKKLEALKQQLEKYKTAISNGEKIISDLTAKHEKAAKTYGETSEQAKEYAKQLAQAQAAQARNEKAADDLNLKIVNQDTAVKNAKSQVDNYKTALDSMRNSTENTANKTETLTEKVNRQESELKELKTQYANVASEQGATSNEAQELANKISELSGELKENRTKLDAASDAADEFDQSLEEVDDSANETTDGGLSTFGVALGNLAANIISNVIAKMKEMITETIEVGKTFDSSMSQVAAVSGASAKDIEQLSKKAKQLGKTTAFTAAQVSDGFNYMAMAGWKTEDMLNGIEGILNLAAASGSDLATTSDIVTDALTAMGYSAADAGRLADVMAAAASNANTNVEMMGATFQYAAPVVGALGYNMEDTAVAIGLMANAGIKGEKAGTALRSILTRLSTDAGASANSLGALGTLTEELGVQFYNADGTTRDLNDVLNEARKAWANLSEEQQVSYGKTIAGQEALSGWLAIMNAAPEDIDKLTDAVENSDGAAKKMADTMLDNLGGDMTLLQSKLEGVQLALYQKFEPALRKGAKALDKLLDIVKIIVDNIEPFEPLIIGIATAIGTLTTALIGLFIVNKLKTAFAALNAVLAANPIMMIVAAIAGLVAAFIYLWNNCDEFRKFWINLWESIKETVGAAWDKTREVFSMIWEFLQPYIEQAKELLSAALTEIGEMFAAAWGAIQAIWDFVEPYFMNIWENIKAVFSVVSEVLGGFFSAAWDYIQLVWDVASEYFSMVWENIKIVFSAVKKTLTAYFKAAWTSIKAIWDVVSGYFSMIWENIKLTFSVVEKVFKGDFSGAWEAIKQIWNNVAGYFETVWNSIKTIFSSVTTFFQTAFSDAWEAIKGVFSNVGEFFSGIWETITSKFTTIGTKIGDAIGSAFKTAINAVIGTVENAINFIPDAINGAIDLINELPGVDISPIPTVSLPRLAKGGIVNGATLAEIGENGAEAIIPLEKNKAGLKKIASLLANEMNSGASASGKTAANNVTYTFNQTNNSPKALSRWEIYRQTKNLINAAKGV